MRKCPLTARWREPGGRGDTANQLEKFGDRMFHGPSLGIEFFGGSRAFLRASSDGLSDLVHFAHCGIDLTDPLSLFTGSARHRGNQLVHFSP